MKTYENYPWWSVLVTILFNLAIVVIGAVIIFQFGLLWLIVYLIYFAILEITYYPRACVYCYYYGKWCFCGKGKMAGWLFKKKDPSYFCKRKIGFASMLPEMLMTVVPIILGILLLVQHFKWWILVLIVVDFILMSFGNGFIRGKLACPHCKQAELCCPASNFFAKVQRKETNNE